MCLSPFCVDINRLLYRKGREDLTFTVLMEAKLEVQEASLVKTSLLLNPVAEKTREQERGADLYSQLAHSQDNAIGKGRNRMTSSPHIKSQLSMLLHQELSFRHRKLRGGAYTNNTNNSICRKKNGLAGCNQQLKLLKGMSSGSGATD